MISIEKSVVYGDERALKCLVVSKWAIVAPLIAVAATMICPPLYSELIIIPRICSFSCPTGWEHEKSYQTSHTLKVSCVLGSSKYREKPTLTVSRYRKWRNPHFLPMHEFINKSELP